MDLKSLQTRYRDGAAPVNVALQVLQSCESKPELRASFVSLASEKQVRQASADAEAIAHASR